MTIDGALEMMKQAMLVVAMVGGPALLAAVIVGVVISVAQTVTQVNDQSITFVAKLVFVGSTILLFGPFILGEMVRYIRQMISSIAGVVQ
ncbi:MAG: flagellar biosynthetic protein FliQ [Myxococcales bacterium]